MVKKGEAFEIRVMLVLKRELVSGDLGIDPDDAKIQHHPQYWSRAKQKSITFDISLELYRRNSELPFFIWIWECKDYSHNVPVDDVEEFHAKLEQVDLHKTKGTIATQHGFQEGALNVAEAYGIGLARFLPDGTVIRLLEAIIPVRNEDVVFGLIETETTKLDSMFFGLTSSGKAFKKSSDFIKSEFFSVKP